MRTAGAASTATWSDAHSTTTGSWSDVPHDLFVHNLTALSANRHLHGLLSAVSQRQRLGRSTAAAGIWRSARRLYGMDALAFAERQLRERDDWTMATRMSRRNASCDAFAIAPCRPASPAAQSRATAAAQTALPITSHGVFLASGSACTSRPS